MPLFLSAVLGLIACHGASAHPLSQGALEVVVHPDHIAVSTRITLEEFSVTNILIPPSEAVAAGSPAAVPDAQQDEASARFDAECERHARYFVSHLRLMLNGEPLQGKVLRAGETPRPSGATQDVVAYQLEYRLADGSEPRASGTRLASASTLELRDDVLNDASFLPGTTWETSYVVRIIQPGGPSAEGLLLTAKNPVSFVLGSIATDDAAAGVFSTVSTEVRVDRLKLTRDYLWHGVTHILHGYDHLLFISALVLAATGGWDLIRVVTAFTLAHTVTLTLAAFNLVHLPSWIVEPMIAASIVFVAVQNVFWPRSSRGWGRLGAAFFFGLFHGLGFAGGLLDAMQGMRGSTVLLAIVAFSFGVEIGHQAIVLPLFALLRFGRHLHRDEQAKALASLRAQRFGSALISIAGMFYLVVALRVSFGSGGRL